MVGNQAPAAILLAFIPTVISDRGGVFVMGIGALLLGVVLMIIWQLKAPPFFRGETLHQDTPILVPEP